MRYDVIVIGAGPAGLSAARAAAGAGRSGESAAADGAGAVARGGRAGGTGGADAGGAGRAGETAGAVAEGAGRAVGAGGLRVALLDGAARPGGQFWRHRAGQAPVAFDLANVDYFADSRVWFLEAGFTVHTEDAVYQGDRLILATGAYDRTIPFPGWQLPGVVTAGAAQALLKEHGTLIGKRIVVAGSGPFLLPVAAGLAKAGAAIPAVLEAARLRGYLKHPPPIGKAGEAATYLWTLAKARIPYKRGQRIVAAHGDGRLEAVTTSRGEVIECDALAIGYGFTPQIELALAVGCEVETVDGSLIVRTGPNQSTSVPGALAAGELTGIGGSDLAIVEGTIAGLAAAGQEVPHALVRKRARLRRFARALQELHPVPQVDCPDETVVCRCEEVTAANIRTASAIDGRGVKLMTRAGMGWCQGRTCGYAVACLLAERDGRSVATADLLAFGNRPIAQPVTLGLLADGVVEESS